METAPSGETLDMHYLTMLGNGLVDSLVSAAARPTAGLLVDSRGRSKKLQCHPVRRRNTLLGCGALAQQARTAKLTSSDCTIASGIE